MKKSNPNVNEKRKKEAIRIEKEKVKQKIYNKSIAQKARELAIQELYEEGLIENHQKRESIKQEINDIVWNRDGGKCVQCGSSENLEFDHIIPFSKGGANTARNLQLLC